MGRGSNTVSGLGGRFAYNFSKHLALDAEANFFPEAHLLNEEFGQKMQGFAGIKAGVRKKRVGVFAKARPGVMWFGEFSSRGPAPQLRLVQYAECRMKKISRWTLAVFSNSIRLIVSFLEQTLVTRLFAIPATR